VAEDAVETTTITAFSNTITTKEEDRAVAEEVDVVDEVVDEVLDEVDVVAVVEKVVTTTTFSNRQQQPFHSMTKIWTNSKILWDAEEGAGEVAVEVAAEVATWRNP
jgi:hypothetical protein